MEGHIKKDVITVGALAGMPCWHVNFLVAGKDPKTEEELLNIILGSKYKYVMVRGNLSTHSGIRNFINGLSMKGKTVIFFTDSSEDVGPVLMARNIHLVILADPPTAEKNNIHMSLFRFLRDKDEVDFQIQTLDKYEQVREYLKGRTVINPVIIFNISFADEAEREMIVAKYLDDSQFFGYQSRLVQMLNLA